MSLVKCMTNLQENMQIKFLHPRFDTLTEYQPLTSDLQLTDLFWQADTIWKYGLFNKLEHERYLTNHWYAVQPEKGILINVHFQIAKLRFSMIFADFCHNYWIFKKLAGVDFKR